MIYEKTGTREARNLRENKNGICVREADSKIVSYNREEIMPIPSKEIKKRALKKALIKSGEKRRSRLSPMKLITVAAAALFCVFTLDSRLCGGALSIKTRSLLENTLESLLCEDEKPFRQEEKAISEAKEKTEIQEVIIEESKQDEPLPKKAPSEDEQAHVAASTAENAPVCVDGDTFYPIVTRDLSSQSVAVLSNATSYSPDMESAVSEKPPALENLVINENEPLVLIVHTHGSECYTDYTDMYPQDEATRSEDTDKNVVRVGKEIADTLESYGINTIHCTKLCDKPSFINAYNVSHDTVKEYLEKYPSIRIVIDVHRDAIVKENGESIRPAVTIAGQEYAQLMFVVGTDQSGHSHPGWKDNLSLAATVQSAALERYPSLFRSINLRSVPFNQWLSDGYLLLEAGSVSNSLDEALLSAQAFAHTLTAVIKENAV